jgi:7 transmembrane helices usually fused to an inactive transglutaminase/Transglutaminase-like superfamily
MAKTWLSVVTAGVLVVLSLAILCTRRWVLGEETSGPPGWRVTLLVEGSLTSRDASITTVRPLDFRRQHVFDEHFQSSKDLRDPVKTRKTASGLQRFSWRRQGGMGAGAEPFRLEYSFLCSLQRPSPAMQRRTAQIDVPPAAGVFLKSAPRIQSRDEQIKRLAVERALDGVAPMEQVRALFDFVADLPDREAPASQTALACLRGGNASGKSRLLVALCRARGIPARLIGGLILADENPQRMHRWAEAWVNGKWLPMCPAHDHFGDRTFPENYLVMRVGDGPAVAARGARFQYTFTVQNSHGPVGVASGQAPSPAKMFWRGLSLYALRPVEQHVVKFLLLLPLAALIVSVVRTLIGVPTFGTFSPALIGLMFVDLKSLTWGMPIFVLTVLVGWVIRRVLDRFNLLQVPRVGAMLTLIVLFLLAMIVLASRLGVMTTQYVALFPLVILTHLVERFWTIESEDGTAASFRTLAGTLAVAVTISLVLAPEAVSTWMFRYPETLGVVLAAQILLGRYTGYRLTELYRFADLIQDDLPMGGDHDLEGALAEAPATGHPGHESAQRPVHSGPEPQEAFSAGGLQEPDARPVPDDRRPHA